MTICIESINTSKEKGTTKKPVDQAVITTEGIEHDAHAGMWHRQISLLSKEAIQKFSDETDQLINPGDFGENIILSGIDLTTVSVLDRFKIGDVIFEITQLGKKCHNGGCVIVQKTGDCVMPREGIFVRVITPGKIAVGDDVEYQKRTFNIHVITLSDRASKGEYRDQSGPQIQEMLDSFFYDKRWHVSIDRSVIPDEASLLKEMLLHDTENFTDVVFTTGGTGIGPRDIAPEVVTEVIDKEITGIMEYIRVTYGSSIPSAQLSRSVAGVKDKTLIYTLPGSVKAVTEYMTEILKSMEHAVIMLHGIGH